MALDAGPASNNAELTFNSQAPGLEVHVGAAPTNALNPLNPCFAPFVDPSIAYTGAIVNKVVAGIQVTIPS